MPNICTYTYDPNILTQAKVNREFSMIHKHLCYLESQTGGGSGTVTSVGLSLPSIFSVSGSPVTESGTLTATLGTQTANTVFAGPGTGAAAAPTFRALVTADIPAPVVASGLTLNQFSLGASTISLGQAQGAAGDPSRLDGNTEIVTNGYNLTFGRFAAGFGQYVNIDPNLNVAVNASASGTNPLLSLSANSVQMFAVGPIGKTAIAKTGAATANLHIGAGTSAAGTAPIKLVAGTLLTALELGAIEFVDDGTTGHLYITLNQSGVLTRVQIV